ncbi:class II aldolase/adducin family protein [Dyella solisilvae]|uniref:Class II aldolase/adducin family protein n=1 Tax=Dyella solisilvae TaxID=1920168 RepID=A0A370KC16_9GAMM|nr:class II aldolase/adducin family protein [Dyella solisilvae]RDJ00132.1 class II aldolase/adducin family protein [Dyella solisilvae]
MRFATARQRVVEVSRALADRGYFAATGGNLALRVDDEHIVVTPSATDYQRMEAADVCVLRLADLVKVDGERKPSVESGMHAQVLRARRDCRASVHTHQPAASACTLLGSGLPVDGPVRRRLLGPEVPLVGYAPSGTSWLSGKLARALRPDINAYLLRTHGAICCGDTLETTLQALVALESQALQCLRGRIAERLATQRTPDKALQRLLATIEAHPVQDVTA